MGIAVIIALVGLIGQTAADVGGLKPYTVRLKNQPEPLHLLVNPAQLDKISFKAMRDEPWRTDLHLETIQRSYVQEDGIEPEVPALREARLKKGWVEHGGVPASTRSGGQRWVLKDEKQWADKAQAMARAAYAHEPEAAPAAAALPEAESRPGPGLAQLWAPHAAIVAAAVALVAGVFLTLFRKRERWQPLDSGSTGPRRR